MGKHWALGRKEKRRLTDLAQANAEKEGSFDITMLAEVQSHSFTRVCVHAVSSSQVEDLEETLNTALDGFRQEFYNMYPMAGKNIQLGIFLS